MRGVEFVGFQSREAGWLGVRTGEVVATRFRKGKRVFWLWSVRRDAGLPAPVGSGLRLDGSSDVTASNGGWLGAAASNPRPIGTITED